MALAGAESRIQVLLVEQEPDTISLVSLCLSEIQECQLHVASSGEEALMLIPEIRPDLILLAQGLHGRDSLDVLREIHLNYPTIYLIVSLVRKDLDLVHNYGKAGATDCVSKGTNYIPDLINAVKSALIRIADRQSFQLPPMTRATQLVMDENLPDIVFLLDLEGKFLYVNRAVSEILGHEQKDVVGRTIMDYSAPEHQKLLRAYLDKVTMAPSYAGQILLINKFGNMELFETNCTLMEDQTIYGVARQLDHDFPADSDAEDTVKQPEESPSQQDEVLPARLGPYRIITLLGAGSMGRVYKGFDEQLERNVAIKVISKALTSDQDYVERFRREAKVLASISHPNIALIYYFDNVDGLPYFCMEYLHGGSLETVLLENKTLDPETAISYTMQVALGLSEAEKKGVIHRDIKPSNIMLAENNRIKIVDFGLAKIGREKQDLDSSIVGTPLYMSPEQLQGGAVDFRCDIYALGLSFFRMLYGFIPFSGTTIGEVFSRRLHEDLPVRDKLNPSVPSSLYRIITVMTARDPEKRYAKYSDLVEALENSRRAILQGTAVTEEPAPRPAGEAIRMRGTLYDRPLPEILGEVARMELSGKLTLSWIDLVKTLHIKNGKIVAVLSNQEGERFYELMQQWHQITGKKAREISESSIDLYMNYSSMMSSVPPETRQKMFHSIQDLGWRILQGLFSWVVGEFIFEDGNFPAQLMLEIETSDIVTRGVKEFMDFATIRRRLMEGKCRIVLAPDHDRLLKSIKIAPSDAFLLFRFENNITFQELLNLSGVPEESFYRLIYLFHCFGIITLSRMDDDIAGPSARKLERTPVPTPRKPAAPAKKPASKVAAPVITTEEPSSPSQRPRSAVEDPGLYYYRCAVESHKNKNYWACVEYCKKALEYRKDASIYDLMGQAFSTHLKFRHEAMDAFQKAIEMDPTNPKIIRNMADLYFYTANYALARAKYQEVLKFDSTDEHSKARLGEIAIKMKR